LDPLDLSGSCSGDAGLAREPSYGCRVSRSSDFKEIWEKKLELMELRKLADHDCRIDTGLTPFSSAMFIGLIGNRPIMLCISGCTCGGQLRDGSAAAGAQRHPRPDHAMHCQTPKTRSTGVGFNHVST